MTSALTIGVFNAVGVAEDRQQGFFDRLRSLPAPRLALLVGRVVGDSSIQPGEPRSPQPSDSRSAFGSRHNRRRAPGIRTVSRIRLCVPVGFPLHRAGIEQRAGRPGPLDARLPGHVRVERVRSREHAPSWMRPVADHQPITIMCNAVWSLALGNPALAGLGHTTSYWVLLSLAWAAGITSCSRPSQRSCTDDPHDRRPATVGRPIRGTSPLQNRSPQRPAFVPTPESGSDGAAPSRTIW